MTMTNLERAAEAQLFILDHCATRDGQVVDTAVFKNAAFTMRKMLEALRVSRPALPTREEIAQTLCHPTKRESIDAILALFTLTGEQDQSISKASYCALCDLEHQLHEDAQGFHHVIKGKRVACASAKSGEEG